MNSMQEYTPYIGYLASALVLISFLMKKIIYLRVINSFGCAFFIIYGTLISSVPVVITNVAIVMVNIYYLTRKTE
jgi:hypothetical protein